MKVQRSKDIVKSKFKGKMRKVKSQSFLGQKTKLKGYGCRSKVKVQGSKFEGYRLKVKGRG